MVNFRPLAAGIFSIGLASASAIHRARRSPELTPMDRMNSMDRMSSEMINKMEVEKLMTGMDHADRISMDATNMVEATNKMDMMNMMEMNIAEKMNEMSMMGKRDKTDEMERSDTMDRMERVGQMGNMDNYMGNTEIMGQVNKRDQMNQMTEMSGAEVAARLIEVAMMMDMTEYNADSTAAQSLTTTTIYYCQNINFIDPSLCREETVVLGKCSNLAPEYQGQVRSLENSSPNLGECRWYADSNCRGAYFESNYDSDLRNDGWNDRIKSVRCGRHVGPYPGKCDWSLYRD